MTGFDVHFDGEAMDKPTSDAVVKALDAFKAFVLSPNETATDHNNALQKAAGEARKAIMGDAIKKAPKPGKGGAK